MTDVQAAPPLVIREPLNRTKPRVLDQSFVGIDCERRGPVTIFPRYENPPVMSVRLWFDGEHCTAWIA